MYSVTVVGLVIVAVVVLAAISGWASSGITRLGRELGLVMGLLAGLAVAMALLGNVHGPGAALLVLFGVTLGGGVLGAAVLGMVGHEVARGLYHLRLGLLDRVIGAALSGVGAVVLCVLAVHVFALAAPNSSISWAVRHDAIAHLMTHPHVLLWV